MARSKLFTPQLRDHWGTMRKAEEDDSMFVAVPTHAEIPVFNAPTTPIEPAFPLSLGGERQTHAKPVERRTIGTGKGRKAKY